MTHRTIATAALWTLASGALYGCTAVPLESGRIEAVDATGKLPYPEMARRFADQTPPHVTKGALDSVVVLFEPRSKVLGSATVIGPDRLLTAAHVLDGFPRHEDGSVLLDVDGQKTKARILAIGNEEDPHGDWAILRTDRPRWKKFATVHEPAWDPKWEPRVGTEILLVGYASGFFPDLEIDTDAPTPSIVATIQPVKAAVTEHERISWFAKGDYCHLGGMSGGAAMVWNPKERRAELFGVFRGYAPTREVETTRTRILGIQVWESVREVPGLVYMIHRLPVQHMRRSR